jgi:hypothetical protein
MRNKGGLEDGCCWELIWDNDDRQGRRKIRHVDDNAKCRRLKIDLYKPGFAAGVDLSEAQSTIHCIRVYSILIHTGKGEEGKS